MTDYLPLTEDNLGRQIHPVLFNTAKDGSGTWYFALVDSSGRLVLGTSTATIGKLGANSGVDIGDVDVTSLIPGVAATNLGKAEDSAHASGDTGVMALGVRKNKHESIAGTDGDYTPQQLDRWGGIRPAEWEFGPPELRADNTGWARWENKSLNRNDVMGTEPNRQFRQGPWAVHLNGGNQNWVSGGYEDFASVWIPVNEMKVTDLDEIMFTYYKDLAGTSDVGVAAPNIAIRVHDPADHDARAEITDTGAETVTEGWHEIIFNSSATAVLWYGNNTGTHDTTVDEGTNYTWADYQTDDVFSTYTVYQINIDYGYWGAQRSTGDAWIGSCQINDIPIKWEPKDRVHLGTRDCFNLDSWVFGKPTVKAVNNSRADWTRGDPNMTGGGHLKGSTGWLAHLYGGVQTNDDWAAVNIPVNELPVSCFNTARWSYLMTAAESAGINIVIWLHDPYDFDKRVEVTQRGDITGLTRTQGWHAHILDPDATQFYYYGEGEANESICVDEGTDYTWKEYQGDECFNTWVIYRITFEYGWWASGTFDDAYVADISLNNHAILLGPPDGKHKKTVVVVKTMKGAAKTADEVISDDADWDFLFGGTGYITKAIATHNNTLTSRVSLLLFSRPVGGAVNDEAANDNPVSTEQPFYVGRIDFPAFSYNGTGDASTLATPSTVGNLPLAFDAPILYGVLIAIDATTTVAEVLTIALTADMEDN